MDHIQRNYSTMVTPCVNTMLVFRLGLEVSIDMIQIFRMYVGGVCAYVV